MGNTKKIYLAVFHGEYVRGVVPVILFLEVMIRTDTGILQFE